LGLGSRFIEQGDHHDRALLASHPPPLRLRPPRPANSRMENVLQRFTRVRTAKNHLRQQFSVQRSFARKYALTENSANLFQRRFARLDKLSREYIGIDDLLAVAREILRRRALTHPD